MLPCRIEFWRMYCWENASTLSLFLQTCTNICLLYVFSHYNTIVLRSEKITCDYEQAGLFSYRFNFLWIFYWWQYLDPVFGSFAVNCPFKFIKQLIIRWFEKIIWDHEILPFQFTLDFPTDEWRVCLLFNHSATCCLIKVLSWIKWHVNVLIWKINLITLFS